MCTCMHTHTHIYIYTHTRTHNEHTVLSMLRTDMEPCPLCLHRSRSRQRGVPPPPATNSTHSTHSTQLQGRAAATWRFQQCMTHVRHGEGYAMTSAGHSGGSVTVVVSVSWFSFGVRVSLCCAIPHSPRVPRVDAGWMPAVAHTSVQPTTHEPD